MTRDDILQELFETEFVEKYTRQLCMRPDLLEDYVQEVWLLIAELPEDKLQEMYQIDGINTIRRYVSGVINRTVRSKTSAAYYKLIKRGIETMQRKMTADNEIKFDEVNGWD